jgi:hypothetical protein
MNYSDPDLDIATDPAMAKLLHEELRRAASAKDEDSLRAEIAREILEGRMRASEVGQWSFYREALLTAVDDFLRWRDSVSDSEYAEYERRASEYVESVRRELEQGDSGQTMSGSKEAQNGA